MVSKSQSLKSVRRAVRFAPLFACVTTLAFVAACARTNGGKTRISSEDREAAITKALSAEGLPAPYEPSSMTVAQKIKSASLSLDTLTDQSPTVDANLIVSMTDGDLQGVGPIAVGNGAFVKKDFSPLTTTAASQKPTVYSLAAHCKDAKCNGVIALVIENDVDQEATNKAIADAVQVYQTANPAPAAAADDADQPAKDAATAAKVAYDKQLADVRSGVAPVGKEKGVAVLMFGAHRATTKGADGQATEVESGVVTYTLEWSTPTEAAKFDSGKDVITKNSTAAPAAFAKPAAGSAAVAKMPSSAAELAARVSTFAAPLPVANGSSSQLNLGALPTVPDTSVQPADTSPAAVAASNAAAAATVNAAAPATTPAAPPATAANAPADPNQPIAIDPSKMSNIDVLTDAIPVDAAAGSTSNGSAQ